LIAVEVEHDVRHGALAQEVGDLVQLLGLLEAGPRELTDAHPAPAAARIGLDQPRELLAAPAETVEERGHRAADEQHGQLAVVPLAQGLHEARLPRSKLAES
jgi:hypothetical protein